MSTTFTPDFRPRLRTHLAAGMENGQLWLYDPRRVAREPLAITRLEIDILQQFTGEITVAEVHQWLVARSDPGSHTTTTLLDLVRRLDAGLFLEGDMLQRMFADPIRPPSCIGCYPAEPDAIHVQMRTLFTAAGGPGLPSANAKKNSRLRAVLVPHMDYARGNVTYGWGFKELAEQTDAKLFVIIATSHHSPNRFSLTRKNFQTPLGTVPTDQAYLDRIVRVYGDGLFDDPYAHLPEHSIELEVVVMQHLFGEKPFRIVPLLAGSFHDCVESRRSPIDHASTRRMIQALRAAEAEAGEEVCYVISGDLAHIGPKFGDPEPVNTQQLAESESQDRKLLVQLKDTNIEGYFDVIANEGDARRICGLPPTYVALRAAAPKRGKVLHYQQFVHPQGHESVSFASAAFYE
jgi:MEMO1 family protein